MGFLGDVFGGALQVVGDLISHVSPTIGSAIWDIGFDIEFGGSSSSYSSNTASAQETIDLQAECNKACQDTEKKTKKAIGEVIKEAKSSVQSFEKKIKKLGAAGLDFSLPDDYFDSMEDAYLDYIQREISLDAEEFMKILEIKDDKKRKDECKKYIDTVVYGAKKHAIDYLNNKRYDALDSMTKEMKVYLDEKESTMKERKRQLDELESKKDDEEFINRIYMEHVVDISFLNCIRSECI